MAGDEFGKEERESGRERVVGNIQVEKLKKPPKLKNSQNLTS